MPTTKNDELEKLDRAITGQLHNGMYDLHADITSVIGNNKEIEAKVASVYAAIESLQSALSKLKD